VTAGLSNRFEEYPKLREFILLKDEQIQKTNTPPMYVFFLPPLLFIKFEFIFYRVSNTPGNLLEIYKVSCKFLANVNSRSRSLYAIARPSVCRLSVCRLLSVTLVHPTQAVQIFGNISTAFGTLAIR